MTGVKFLCVIIILLIINSMGQEYTPRIEINSINSTPPIESVQLPLASAGEFNPTPSAIFTITPVSDDIYTQASALNVAIAATGAQNARLTKSLPFIKQRYINFECTIGIRTGNVTTKNADFEFQWWSNDKNGKARFRIGRWGNDVVDLYVYDNNVSDFVQVGTDVALPFEGNTFVTLKLRIDTVLKKWESLRVGGESYSVSDYELETITSATQPDANNATYFTFTAQSLTTGNTFQYTIGRFLFEGQSI